MNTPPLLMLAALAWWGWQTDLFQWGMALGGALEASRRVRLRWDPAPDDFRRLWNVTVLLCLGAGLYLFFSQGGWGATTDLLRSPGQGAESLRQATRIGLRFLQWLPLLFFPFIGCHTYSHAGWLPWSTVSPLAARRALRRAGSDTVTLPSRGFHPTYPYWGMVLFAASASDRGPTYYFPALALLVAWGLWPERTRRFHPVTWAATFIVVLGLAYAGQQGVAWGYQRLEQLQGRWLSRLGGSGFDPGGTMIDMGAIARRKPSSRIVLRVRSDTGSPPALLREAVFTRYRLGYWSAGRRDYAPVPALPDQETWRLTRAAVEAQTASILRYSRQSAMTLALPGDAVEIRALPASLVETNALTAARAQGVAALATYAVRFGPGGGFDTPPEAEDLDLEHLAAADRRAIERLARELGLAQLSARDAITRLSSFLLSQFRYTLNPSVPRRPTGTNDSVLADFLFDRREGHCEYFASVTTLALRAARIPTRYVVGYSVQEQQGDTFVVRSRHAHAWSLAWLDGRWRELDHTPGGWAEREAALAPWWEALYDRASALWLAFTQWRQGETRWRLYVFVAGIGLLAWMAWREIRGGRWRRAQRRGTTLDSRPPAPGLDSEFYVIERILARRGARREPSLPLAEWLGRLQLPSDQIAEEAQRLLRLHYRLRFDPAGLTPADREVLRTGASAWMRR